MLYAKGKVTRIKKKVLVGEVELELDENSNYLGWTQCGNLFAACDDKNVATFWSALSGKVVHK